MEGYELVKGADRQRVSPGTMVLERLIGQQPTLIILDEIALHLRTAKATPAGNSNLASQVVPFLFSVMDLAAACNNLVFVYTLASTSDSFGEETTEIREAMQASARQERILKPSTDVEIYNIVKQRVFSSVDAKAAEATAREYHHTYKASQVNLPDGCKDASYAQAIEDSYPFHPELFNLLTKKIASIPNFQRTRGALRLFALLARHLWGTRQEGMPLINAHHLPVGIDEELTSDLTSRLERPLMRMPIQADIYNPDGREAHAQVQDQEWLAAGKPPFSTWIGRTIFLHSLTQGTSSGIRRAELNLSLLTPGLEISFVDRAIERLEAVAWYLDSDPITTISRFKEEPSINKIIAEEKEQVSRTEAKDDLRSRRDTIFAEKFFKLVSSPESAADVDDQPEPPVLCLIDFNEATVTATTDGPPSLVEQIFNNTGESGRFRTFRNRLLFLVANKSELEQAIDNAREYRAIKNILSSQSRLDDMSDTQQKQLRAKEGEMDLSVRVSLTNAYRHLFYPANDPVKASKGLLHYSLPAQDASDVKGKKNQQEVILKALKDCQKIRTEEASPFAPAYILQKAWPAGLDQWTTKALRDAFAKDLSLNILLDLLAWDAFQAREFPFDDARQLALAIGGFNVADLARTHKLIDSASGTCRFLSPEQRLKKRAFSITDNEFSATYLIDGLHAIIAIYLEEQSIEPVRRFMRATGLINNDLFMRAFAVALKVIPPIRDERKRIPEEKALSDLWLAMDEIKAKVLYVQPQLDLEGGQQTLNFDALDGATNEP